MKFKTAKSIIFQHGVAAEKLIEIAAQLNDAQTKVDVLDQTLKAPLQQELDNWVDELENLNARKSVLVEEITKRRALLSQTPDELRQAQILLAQTKDRHAAYKRQVERWERELDEAKATVSETEKRVEEKQGPKIRALPEPKTVRVRHDPMGNKPLGMPEPKTEHTGTRYHNS